MRQSIVAGEVWIKLRLRRVGITITRRLGAWTSAGDSCRASTADYRCAGQILYRATSARVIATRSCRLSGCRSASNSVRAVAGLERTTAAPGSVSKTMNRSRQHVFLMSLCLCVKLSEQTARTCTRLHDPVGTRLCCIHQCHYHLDRKSCHVSGHLRGQSYSFTPWFGRETCGHASDKTVPTTRLGARSGPVPGQTLYPRQHNCRPVAEESAHVSR
jgi:hypothetical protein